MLYLLFTVVCLLVPTHAVDLQPTLLPPLTLTGTSYIVSALQEAQGAINASAEAFKPVNDTCNTIITAKAIKCGECVKAKCEQRIKDIASSCADPISQAILALIDFGKDVGNFFSATLPNFIVDDVGGHIIDAGQEVGNFFTGTLIEGLHQIGDTITDIGDQIGGGIVDLGSFFEDLGNNILGGLVDAGNFLLDNTIDIGNALGGFFGNLGSNIGDFFGGLGRKRRSLYLRSFHHMMMLKQGEPGCDDFKDEEAASKACLYYVAKCADCDIDKNKDCPGYKEAYDDILSAAQDASWMSGINELKYGVKKVQYGAFDPVTMGFKDIQVDVEIFGSATSLALPEAVNVFDAQAAGPVIARHSVDWFKSQNYYK